MSHAEDIARARQAQALIENPLLEEVLEGIEARAVKALLNTAPKDAEKREQLYHLHAGVKSFRQELTKILNRGTNSADALEREQQGGVSVPAGLPARRSVSEGSPNRI